MAEITPADSEGPAVPDLVDDYRTRLDSLRNQARDLARMRGDVLAAAERESQAIVTAARGEIREILVKARRELVVLAAQVQAVTEHEGAPDPAREPSVFDPRSASEVSHDRLVSSTAGARHEVRRVLSEARPDLDALTTDARALRSNLIALGAAAEAVTPGRPAVKETVHAPAPEASTQASPPPASRDESPFGPRATVHHLPPADIDMHPPLFESETSPLGPPADREHDTRLNEKPALAGFAQPTPSPVRMFVVAFAALATLVVFGTGWWFYRQPSQRAVDSVPTARAAEPTGITNDEAPAAVPPADAISSDDQKETPATDGSLTIEARKASWIRARVDGRPDAGRLYGPGETRQITGASRVSVRAGDAGAVFITVNGGTPEALGPDGQAVTRDFILRVTSEPSPPPPGAVISPAPPAVEPGRSGPNETSPVLSAPKASATPVPAPPPASRVEPAPVVLPLPPPPPVSPALTGVVRAQTPDDDLVTLSQRWLDGYVAGNSNTMMAVSGGTPDIRDQRSPDDRLASGLASSSARRSFETPKLQRGADIGVFSVRMTERGRADAVGQPQEHVALVTQVWMRRAGKWQLIDVRIVGESQVKQISATP